MYLMQLHNVGEPSMEGFILLQQSLFTGLIHHAFGLLRRFVLPV